MKSKLLFLYAFTCLFLSPVTAQTYNGDLWLKTQAEIDAFNYTEINGDLTILETVPGNITNLNGLSELTAVQGSLIIGNENGGFQSYNTQLLNLDGLSGLVYIYSNLGIFNNSKLTNINGLSNLTFADAIDIQKNGSLTNLDGLSNVTDINRFIFLIGNSSLNNINGLSKITSLTILTIDGSALENLDGLINLTNAFAIEILYNPWLTNINGLQNVRGLEKILLEGNSRLVNLDGLNDISKLSTLEILGNDRLTNISAFLNLDTVTLDLRLFLNSDIFNLDDLSNLRFVGRTLEISSQGNINGLSNISGALSGSLIIGSSDYTDIDALSGITSVGVTIELFGNKKLTNIDGLSNIEYIGGSLLINSNDALTNIDAFSKIETIDGTRLSVSNNPALENLNGLSNLKFFEGRLTISRNPLLEDLDPLSNLTTTTISQLSISQNPLLSDINALSNITTILQDFDVSSNASLKNLNGFVNLKSVGSNSQGTSFSILNNPSLTSFCGLYKLFKTNGFTGNYFITGNAVNPTGQEIIDMAEELLQISSASTSTTMLAPPNHKMRDVGVYYTVSGGCEPDCELSVTSNEPINGTGDGDTSPDWIIVDKHNIKLRSERAANGSGRIYTVKITCTDIFGNKSIETKEVRVAHNIMGPTSGKSFKVGSTVSFEGEFWDTPVNKHSAKWLIDENTTVKGSVTEPTANKNGKVTASYKFNSPGVYKVQMNITDQNGITTYATTNGDLEAIVVVYDPNGGYTYGGGYFPSPAGALTSNQAATGKASYGFAVNYRNATNPKGETQFEFKVGEFEFNSLNFDYLVVSGAKAQFKGIGKITGGQSGISFIMTVIDGELDGTGVDKVRMKIYNKNTNAVIYDNQPGAGDAADPLTPVGANSEIVINGSNVNNATTRTVSTSMDTEVGLIDGLAVNVYPNPASTYFNIAVNSKIGQEKITIQVYDELGRTVEIRNNVLAGSTIKIGDKYKSGVYLVSVIQGRQYKELKLVKLGN